MTKLRLVAMGFLALVIVLTGITNVVALSSVNKKISDTISVPRVSDVLPSYQMAEKIVKQYYNAEQKREKTLFENVFLHKSLNTYVQKRLEKSRSILFIESEELRNILTGNYFSATCTFEKVEFRNDGLFIKLFVDAEVRYPDQADSYYFGRSIDFLFVKENGELKISDVLFYEDSMVDIPALSSNRWDIRSNSKSINKALQQMESGIEASNHMFANIDEYLTEYQLRTEMEFTKIESKNDGLIPQQKQSDENTTTRATYSFNRVAMVDYAKATAPLKKHTDHKLYTDTNHTISARGSSEAPYYYDFSAISGNYDCTNFISHVLLKGGAKMKDNGVSAPNSTNGGGWYFNNTGAPGASSRLESWAGVNQFGTFLLYNTGNGPRGVLKSSFAGINGGDLVQWKYGQGSYGYPNYGHTTVVTGLYTYGLLLQLYPLITSRSGNGMYDINQRFHDKLNQSNVIGYRLIGLTNHAY